MNKSTTTLLISLSIVAVFVLGIFVYGAHNIRTQNESISVLLNQADAASEEMGTIQKVKSVKADSKEDLARLDEIKITDSELVTFIEELESTGKGLGLSTDILSVSADKPEGNGDLAPHKIHIIVETKGTWSGCMTFVHALENLPYRLLIDNSTMSKDESGIWTNSTSFAIYIFK